MANCGCSFDRRLNRAYADRRARFAVPAISFPLCELAHICPHDSERCCGTPEGGSQFQFPGLARSLTAYCVNGLVLYSARLSNFIDGSSQAGDLPSPSFVREFASPAK